MALEKRVEIDERALAENMKGHEEVSRAGEKKHVVAAIEGDLPTTDDSPKYNGPTTKAKIEAWVKENLVGTGSLQTGDQVGLVLDKTNFYAEQGGQVGDAGWIKTDTGTFEVEDTQRLGNSVIHWGQSLGRDHQDRPNGDARSQPGPARHHAQPHRDASHELGAA